MGVAVVVAAYLLGCVTPGWYLVRWRTGADLRQLGSGSLGARNTARVLGLRWAAVAAIADILKGVISVALALAVAPEWVGPAMVAVVAGHVWPIQLGGHGGRGIAPALGALGMAAPPAALAVVATFAAFTVLGRSLLLPAIAGVVSAPAWLLWLGYPIGSVAGAVAAAAIVVVAHSVPLRALAAR